MCVTRFLFVTPGPTFMLLFKEYLIIPKYIKYVIISKAVYIKNSTQGAMVCRKLYVHIRYYICQNHFICGHVDWIIHLLLVSKM